MKKLQELLEQLRNLDPNDPGRWPFGVRVGTVALLFLIAASAGYYFFVWKPDRPLLLEARAKEGELKVSLETKAKRAANLEAYRSQLAEMEKSFGAMLRQLPNKTELPITIRLTGGYHEMGKFASGIAALPRIVTLHDIEITPQGSTAGDLTLNVTAKTYRYLDEEESGEKKAGQP
jgi:type IV pilus assembly protein PilO